MAILFACQSATCPEQHLIVEFLSDARRQPACDDCGAVLEPLELDADRPREAA